MKEAPRDEIECEATVLHVGSAIQRGAGLLLIDRASLRIVAANQALSRRYDNPADLRAVFKDTDADAIRTEMEGRHPGEPRFMRLRGGELIWASFFDAGTSVGVDITYIDRQQERFKAASHSFAKCARRMSREFDLLMQSETPDPDKYYDSLVTGTRRVSGFDRVMLYRFDSDMNGEVVAEARSNDTVASFLGLKFPSSDIPRPARDLFLRNRVRQVIEVAAPPDPVVTVDGNETPVVFDQSDSAFRYTSPVHLEYLKNMGVAATLTIGIVMRGALWGLLSCHSTSGRRQLPPGELMLCQIISELASNHIARLLEAKRNRASAQVKELLSRMSSETVGIETSDEFADMVSGFQNELLRVLGADGLQFESETTNLIIGATPSYDCVKAIDRFAKKWKKVHDRQFIATSDLVRLNADLPPGCAYFPGLLHFSSWDGKARLKVFRKPARTLETWAGDPDAKTRYKDIGRDVLHPRNSFEAYEQSNLGSGGNWSESEMQIARDLLAGLRNIEMSFHKYMRERQLRQSNAEMRLALKLANYEAHHDELTGIHNRRGFQKLLAEMSPRATRNNTMWLCHFDVDQFKKINDSFGHVAGDEVLRHVATSLTRAVAGRGAVARLGGDEFAVILKGATQAEQVNELCAQFARNLTVPVNFDGFEIVVSCTAGITTFEAGVEDSSTILNRSDLALYSGKGRGPGTFSFFSPDMEYESKSRRALEKEIEQAIEGDQFVPYFQPQIDVQTRAIVGCEMLCRWDHPDKGILTPFAFLKTAMAMGVLGHIDRALFQKAVSIQAAWTETAKNIIPISVNVSFDRLRKKDLITDLVNLGDGARHFTLELLETIDLDEKTVDYEAILRELRATGVGIELDDFGSGRSSILAILTVKPDRLKIDKRLIDPIARDETARNVVKSVIDIGEQLGIKAIAEGVETAHQVDVLAELACDRIQGYFYGRPQPAKQLGRWMASVAA